MPREKASKKAGKGKGTANAKDKLRKDASGKGNANGKAKVPAKKTALAKIGRPSSFNQKTADEFCRLLANGNTVRAVCKMPKMPSTATFYRWLEGNPDFVKQYRLAKEIQADMMADEVIEIADNVGNERNDTIITDKGYEVPNNEWINRSRLRVEARKWYLAKIAPKKYGDKVEQTIVGDPERPCTMTIDVKAMPVDELKDFIRAQTHGKKSK